MSDFSRGLLSGLAGSNGIAGAVNNFALAPYIAAIKAQQARSAAAVQALNEAKLAEMNRNREGLEASRNYLAQHMGIDPAALQGATDYGQLLSASPKLQLMGLGGMLDRGGQAASPVGDIGMAQAADGEALARARSEDRIRANAALFDDFVKKYGEIEHASKGGSMYQYQNNGAAFNPFDGTVTVADPEVRNLYRQKTQADITKSRTQAAKAARSGSSSGGQWETFDENGIRYQRNKNTGKVARIGKLELGGGLDEKMIDTPNGRFSVSEIRQATTQAIMNGANEGAAKSRFKELTGENY